MKSDEEKWRAASPCNILLEDCVEGKQMSEKITVDKAEWDRLKGIEQDNNLKVIREMKVDDEIFWPDNFPHRPGDLGKWITIKYIGELSDRVHIVDTDDKRHSVRYHEKYKVKIK